MMIISHVVALSNNNVIGVDNNLPWNLKTDLSHFKEYTTNKVIVMGRKTYESIGRPLPNRLNYVVSQTINHIAGAFVFDSIESAIKNAKDYCKENGLDEVVIIGGGFLFRDTLPITNRLVLTKVNCEIEGDVFYPEIDLSDWVEKDSRDFIKDKDNDYDFRVSTYEKLK
ncbi:MAG: dihydrofolate reductase [Gammaproteobacteria bacterium]|nr:dihydrofolate reductase [Gammaproteobacteria bacterium]OUW90468.1 MAG: dihydrofolate reductase [Gammaproteobacteria bacterium TMED234]